MLARKVLSKDRGSLQAPDPFDAIALANGPCFDVARQRHLDLTDQINAHVAQRTPGGLLVPIAQCTTACRPGPLADFLCVMQVDPFQRYNQFYAAADAQTAEALDTVLFDPQLIGAMDDAMVQAFERARHIWAEFKAREPQAERASVLLMRDKIGAQITSFGARVEATLYPTGKHLWKDLIHPPLAHAA